MSSSPCYFLLCGQDGLSAGEYVQQTAHHGQCCLLTVLSQRHAVQLFVHLGQIP